MTQIFFLDQINRLKIRFGAKAFDPEFIRVIGLEIASVSDEFFRKQVDNWIGTRKNNSPPLLTDFKEARLAYEKDRLSIATDKVVKTFSYGLKDVLKKHYNVDSLSDAMEIEKLKIRLGEGK